MVCIVAMVAQLLGAHTFPLPSTTQQLPTFLGFLYCKLLLTSGALLRRVSFNKSEKSDVALSLDNNEFHYVLPLVVCG